MLTLLTTFHLHEILYVNATFYVPPVNNWPVFRIICSSKRRFQLDVRPRVRMADPNDVGGDVTCCLCIKLGSGSVGAALWHRICTAPGGFVQLMKTKQRWLRTAVRNVEVTWHKMSRGCHPVKRSIWSPLPGPGGLSVTPRIHLGPSPKYKTVGALS